MPQTLIEFAMNDPYMAAVGVRIADVPTMKLDSVIGPYDVISTATALNVLVDYPLKHPDIFTLRDMPTGGWARGVFLERLHGLYAAVYAERTKYGVWKHELADLYLESAVFEDDGSVELVVRA
jgi:hypothetical protein